MKNPTFRFRSLITHNRKGKKNPAFVNIIYQSIILFRNIIRNGKTTALILEVISLKPNTLYHYIYKIIVGTIKKDVMYIILYYDVTNNFYKNIAASNHIATHTSMLYKSIK